jgi:PAS domain S-box-containing protein
MVPLRLHNGCSLQEGSDLYKEREVSLMTDTQNTDLQQKEKNEMLGELPAQPVSTAQAAFPSVTRKGLATFLDLAPDALIVVDSVGMIVLVSTQVKTLFGYGQDELVDLPLEILLPERLRAAHVARRTQYMHTAHPRPMGVGLHLIGRRKDGSEFPVDISLRPILIEQTLHVIAAVRDMTALKEAEALKDQFISLATHELRTPVTIVAGYADYLLTRAARKKGHELDEWQREKLQEMKQAAWQLAELIEDLLDVTRVQGGQFQLELRPTDLVALTQQVIKRLQTTTERHHLSFQTVLPQLWATVDPFRIEQVLSNLLSNAIKYSPHGGSIEVTLENNAEEHEAHFRIRDQGLGIPLAQQAHLFERFVRADNVRAAGIRGTGLGLYLCRELIERHGGHIDFESAEGAGSTFFFSLPCAEPCR